VWADLGSGRGAFTLALGDLVGPGARILSVDRDERALSAQRRAMSERFPTINVDYVAADFTKPLDLPPLDGLVMANSLHFVRDKPAVVEGLAQALKPGGRFTLVEYNADRGNPWVPHPLSFETWRRVAEAAGLQETRLIHRVPSRFLREIYSAVSVKR
jgi:SAM-dependent methyltransferase